MNLMQSPEQGIRRPMLRPNHKIQNQKSENEFDPKWPIEKVENPIQDAPHPKLPRPPKEVWPRKQPKRHSIHEYYGKMRNPTCFDQVTQVFGAILES